MNISVLITTYNDSRYLKSSISSILKQTHKDFELLIIDDGSTDNTISIVNSFDDARINYCFINHCGRAAALNYGLRTCKNDWVALLDSDDISLPTRLETYSKLGHLEENTIVVNNVKFFNNSKKIIFSIKLPKGDNSIKKKMALHSSIPNCVFYNRKFILNHDGYDEKYKVAVDYELWSRIVEKAKFVQLPCFLTMMRFRKDSLSNSNYLATSKVVYSLQENSGIVQRRVSQNKGLDNYVFLGWREYFYGSREKARLLWKNLGIRILLSPRLFIAYLFTFMSETTNIKIIENRLKLKLLNRWDDLLLKNKVYNDFLKNYD